VSLARALASHPRALLLDEPVSALDESTRDSVCRELLRIHRMFHIPVIHVCHSSEETRLVASRMAVMGDGCIVQTDTPDNLFERPASPFVARFLRIENLFAGDVLRQDGASFIRCGGCDIRADAPEGTADFIIRSWQVDLGAGRPAANRIRGRLREAAYAGPVARLQIDGPLPLVAQVARRDAEALRLTTGQDIELSFPPEAVHVMQRRPACGPDTERS